MTFWRGAAHAAAVIGRQVVDNLRGLLVGAGGAWLCYGVAGFSRPAAHMLAGALLMSVGVYPYLQPKRKA